jgi:hypothetical protein
MYNTKPDVLGRPMERIEYTTGTEDGMLEQMEEHIPHLEQVYFAGGEPLIMKEHYYLLEKLIEYGKTDIRIQYNTNFSELRFKDKHVFEYWKHFKNVSVGASLDASGARAELMRKGTDWQQTVDNRLRMMKEVPHVDFYVSCTVSSMNVLHVLDFHREWTELGLIQAKDFNINICQSPEWYRADVFPNWFKHEVIKPAYERHIEWLELQDPLKRASNGFKSILNFIMVDQTNKEVEIHKHEYLTMAGKDWPTWDEFLQGKKSGIQEVDDEIATLVDTINKTKEFSEFKIQIKKLDDIRNENFWDTFPEYNVLK